MTSFTQLLTDESENDTQAEELTVSCDLRQHPSFIFVNQFWVDFFPRLSSQYLHFPPHYLPHSATKLPDYRSTVWFRPRHPYLNIEYHPYLNINIALLSFSLSSYLTSKAFKSFVLILLSMTSELSWSEPLQWTLLKSYHIAALNPGAVCTCRISHYDFKHYIGFRS